MAAAPAQHAENATALAVVVVVNWLLAHLANEWVMPAEVANALQSLVIVLLGSVLHRDKSAPAAPGSPPDPVAPAPAPGATP